tara:strand:- start:411 stop:638 length:228 start_codon:yes stop_codon:yes gene_type:complete
MTKIADLRELGLPDLERREDELAEEIFRFRLQHSMGQQEAARKLTESRRDLARVKTLLREQAMAAASISAPETNA